MFNENTDLTLSQEFIKSGGGLAIFEQMITSLSNSNIGLSNEYVDYPIDCCVCCGISLSIFTDEDICRKCKRMLYKAFHKNNYSKNSKCEFFENKQEPIVSMDLSNYGSLKNIDLTCDI